MPLPEPSGTVVAPVAGQARRFPTSPFRAAGNAVEGAAAQRCLAAQGVEQ